MDTPSIPPLKRCSKCKVQFPATPDYFHRNKTKKDGFAELCKPCFVSCRKTRECVPHPDKVKVCKQCGNGYPETPEFFPRNKWKSNGLESIYHDCNRKHVSESRKRDPVRTKKMRHAEYQRRREKHLDYSKKYQSEHPEINRAACKRYRANNLDRVRLLRRASQSRRRAKKAANGGKHTISDIKNQYRSQKGLCWWCGEHVTDTYHVDHRIPLDRGGSNAADNICITCPTCNLSKGSKMSWEWNGRLL